MIHIICLTKSYNQNDWDNWYNYHKSLGFNVIVINNESAININANQNIIGWANQWNLYNKILNENKFNFKEDDYIIFADDDEFWWFENEPFMDIEGAFNDTMMSVITVPQILISTKKIIENRDESYLLTHYYRRADFATQGKCIIKYKPYIKYDFKKKNKEIGHIPYVKYADSKEYSRVSQVISSGLTNTTYGITAYNANIRLYHYHIKSISDWEHKMNRGSAACIKQPYKESIYDNPHFGDYNVIDMEMKIKFESIINRI